MNRMRGFTLIELVIVIVLISIVAGLAGLMLSQGFQAYMTGNPISVLASKENIAADNLMRRLKSAQSISAMGETTLTFIDQSGQSIVMDLSGGTLRQNINGTGANPLCVGIASLGFGFYDASFASTSLPANVAFVTLSMTVTDGNAQYSGISATLIRKKP